MVGVGREAPSGWWSGGAGVAWLQHGRRVWVCGSISATPQQQRAFCAVNSCIAWGWMRAGEEGAVANTGVGRQAAG